MEKKEARLGHRTGNYKAEFYERGRETIVRRYPERDYEELKAEVRNDMDDLSAEKASIYEERTTDGTYSVWYYNESLK